jgi:hypothetical protein
MRKEAEREKRVAAALQGTRTRVGVGCKRGGFYRRGAGEARPSHRWLGTWLRSMERRTEKKTRRERWAWKGEGKEQIRKDGLRASPFFFLLFLQHFLLGKTMEGFEKSFKTN